MSAEARVTSGVDQVEPDVEADDDDGRDPSAVAATGAPGDPTARTLSWYLVRISGLFLAVLLVAQFTSAFLMNDVAKTTAGTMNDRWQGTAGRGFVWLTLSLALVHAGVALHEHVLRRFPSPRTSFALDSVIFVIAAVFIGATTVVVLTLR